MTPDEIRKKLEEAGIPLGEAWSSQKARQVSSPIVERQKENLRSLEKVLEMQIESDQQRVADLHAALQKLKHGGGQ